jgi:predicted AlkP superfamily pyrophosphatase or phosphodiesterase
MIFYTWIYSLLKFFFFPKSTCLNEMHVQGYVTFKIDALFITLWIYVRNIHTHTLSKMFWHLGKKKARRNMFLIVLKNWGLFVVFLESPQQVRMI